MKKSAEQGKGNPHKDKNSFRSRNKRRFKRKVKAKQTKQPLDRRSFPQNDERQFAGGKSSVVDPAFCPQTPQLNNAHNVWIRTYQNIVKWQAQHQLNYWKQCALRLRMENAHLKRRLAVQDSEDEAEEEEARREQQQRWEAATDPAEAEAEAEDSAEEVLDEEFIAFMEVSARHRLERRRLKNESVH